MTFFFHKLKLRNKLLLATFPVAFVVFSVYTVLFYINMKESSQNEAYKNIAHLGVEEGEKIGKPINKAFEVTRTIGAVLNNNDVVTVEPKREFLDRFLKQIAIANPEFVSVWVIMEPNALDGKDAAFANKPGRDPSGRYNGGWRRDKGYLEYDVAFDYNNPKENDYYRIPLTTKQEYIIEPYYHSYTGNPSDKILMTTITVPIIKGDKVIGVAGVDLGLKEINAIINEFKPLNVGSAYLITNQGFYAAHKNENYLGKKIQKLDNSDFKTAVVAGLAKNDDFYLYKINPETSVNELHYFQPIKVGSVCSWYMALTIPESLIYEQLYSSLKFMAIIAFIASLLFGAVVLISAIQISKPILKLSDSAAKIANGDLTEDIKIDTNTKDEIAIMANSLAGITINVRNLLSEASLIHENAVQGKLDYRGDSSKFQGSYQQLIEGFNASLDAIIKPLNIAAEYIDRIAKGDLPRTISEEYKGDFNEIKNNLNMCIDSINALIKSTRELAADAIEGKLNSRADELIHMGDFRKIISGVNSAFDRLVGLIDGMPIPVQIVNRSHDIIYLNHAAKNIEIAAYNDNKKHLN